MDQWFEKQADYYEKRIVANYMASLNYSPRSGGCG